MKPALSCIDRKIRSTPYYDATTAGLGLLTLTFLIKAFGGYQKIAILVVLIGIAYFVYLRFLKPILFSNKVDDSETGISIPSGVELRVTPDLQTQAVHIFFKKYIIVSQMDFAGSKIHRDAIVQHELGHIYFDDAPYYTLNTVVLAATISICIVLIGTVYFFHYIYGVSLIVNDDSTDILKIYQEGGVYERTRFATLYLIFTSICCVFYSRCLIWREFNADHYSYIQDRGALRSFLKKMERQSTVRKKKRHIFEEWVRFWEFLRALFLFLSQRLNTTRNHANKMTLRASMKLVPDKLKPGPIRHWLNKNWSWFTHPKPTERIDALDKNEIGSSAVLSAIYASVAAVSFVFLTSINLIGIDWNHSFAEPNRSLVDYLSIMSVAISIFLCLALHPYYLRRLLSTQRYRVLLFRYIPIYSVCFVMLRAVFVQFLPNQNWFWTWGLVEMLGILEEVICCALSTAVLILMLRTLLWFGKNPTSVVVNSLVGLLGVWVNFLLVHSNYLDLVNTWGVLSFL